MITPQLLSEYNHYKGLGFKHTQIVKDNLRNKVFVSLLPIKYHKESNWLEILTVK
jgi:hypothetical protein